MAYLEQNWTRSLQGGAAGLSLARERNWILAWDDLHWLYLLDQTGQIQSQRHFPELLLGSAADDASAYATIRKDGELCWLAPDLMARWQKNLGHTPSAVAIDSHGQYLAATDLRNHLFIFNRHGQTICRVNTPRPLRFLTFIPKQPQLVGSADYGWVAGYNLEGKVLWQHGLFANVGSLCSDGNGNQILLACFSEGLQHFTVGGVDKGRWKIGRTCQQVSQTFAGDRIVVTGLEMNLNFLEPPGIIQAHHTLEKSACAVLISPLGDDVFVAEHQGIIRSFRRK